GSVHRTAACAPTPNNSVIVETWVAASRLRRLLARVSHRADTQCAAEAPRRAWHEPTWSSFGLGQFGRERFRNCIVMDALTGASICFCVASIPVHAQLRQDCCQRPPSFLAV